MGNSNISPTRIQLKNLTNKLIVAKRGHKMLKDKNDEMTRYFTTLIKKTVLLRKRVESELNSMLEQFVLSKGTMTSVQIYSTFLSMTSCANFGLQIKISTTSHRQKG